ncbi:MAG: purine nucleotide phosphorylase [Hyphomicrobiales bacterium]|nr:purine nucleotide phosphorylase [Hyphomicrobiales bacterium]
MSHARDILQAAGASEIHTAVVLGTGLAAVAGAGDVVIPYAELPGFPQARVSGHQGALVLRKGARGCVAFLLGRAHYYESGDPRAMAGALETLAALGLRNLVLTCAAGGVREDLAPGSLALITDHINFSGTNPLIGVEGDARFTPMVDAYDPALRARMQRAASAAHVALQEAVYMWFSGPSFETPAEVRMAGLLGADLVGMSTVPETILARHLGLRVAAVALVTNHAAGVHGGAPEHAETKRVAALGAEKMQALIAAFLEQDDA